MGTKLVFTDISDTRIKNLFSECCDKLQELNLLTQDLRKKIILKQAPSTEWLGLATYASNRVTLSSYVLEGTDNELKSILLHEILHLVANRKDPNCGHRGLWKVYAQKVTKETGIPITRLSAIKGKAQEDFREARKKKIKTKYSFECSNCKCKIIRLKQSNFTRGFNKLQANGDPLWYCSRCFKTYNKKYPFKKI